MFETCIKHITTLAILVVFLIRKQVRSITLDTWLPDQVSFMQCKLLFSSNIMNTFS